ncbi:MAG: hypothetical protein Q7K42_01435, partial [Candidatus Diapherotrites archaeon]|nr:hypothetical protein [Candidatus Diapherotrites archaeon]
LCSYFSMRPRLLKYKLSISSPAGARNFLKRISGKSTMEQQIHVEEAIRRTRHEEARKLLIEHGDKLFDIKPETNKDLKNSQHPAIVTLDEAKQIWGHAKNSVEPGRLFKIAGQLKDRAGSRAVARFFEDAKWDIGSGIFAVPEMFEEVRSKYSYGNIADGDTILKNLKKGKFPLNREQRTLIRVLELRRVVALAKKSFSKDKIAQTRTLLKRIVKESREIESADERDFFNSQIENLTTRIFDKERLRAHDKKDWPALTKISEAEARFFWNRDPVTAVGLMFEAAEYAEASGMTRRAIRLQNEAVLLEEVLIAKKPKRSNVY